MSGGHAAQTKTGKYGWPSTTIAEPAVETDGAACRRRGSGEQASGEQAEDDAEAGACD